MIVDILIVQVMRTEGPKSLARSDRGAYKERLKDQDPKIEGGRNSCVINE